MTLEEVIKQQKNILTTISRIPNCDTGQYACKDCERCLKIRELGLEYEKLSHSRRSFRKRDLKTDKRLREIKGIGRKAKRSDVYFLLIDMKMTKLEAMDFIGVSQNVMYDWCKNWGFNDRFVKRRRSDEY